MGRVAEFYKSIERKWEKMEKRALSDYIKDTTKKKGGEKEYGKMVK